MNLDKSKCTDWNNLDKPLRDELFTLAKHIFAANKKRGFWDHPVSSRNVGECLMLMVSELAEALEAHRKDATDDKLPEYLGLHVELADCMIRILDFCGAMDIPIGEIVTKKLQYNDTREFKHGKNY